MVEACAVTLLLPDDHKTGRVPSSENSSTRSMVLPSELLTESVLSEVGSVAPVTGASSPTSAAVTTGV